MTVTGLDRLEDLVGIFIFDGDIPSKFNDQIEEMQGIINKLPHDDEDSMYVLKQLFHGTKLNQAMAQLEVHRDESNFMMLLRAALCNPEVAEQIKEMLRD